MQASITHPDWYYLKLGLTLQTEEKPKVEPSAWKMLILQALNTFQGIVGQAIEFDVLETNDDDNTCIVRVPTGDKDNFYDSLVVSMLTIESSSVNIRDDKKQLNGSVRILRRSQYLVGVTGPSRKSWISNEL